MTDLTDEVKNQILKKRELLRKNAPVIYRYFAYHRILKEKKMQGQIKIDEVVNELENNKNPL